MPLQTLQAPNEWKRKQAAPAATGAACGVPPGNRPAWRRGCDSHTAERMGNRRRQGFCPPGYLGARESIGYKIVRGTGGRGKTWKRWPVRLDGRANCAEQAHCVSCRQAMTMRIRHRIPPRNDPLCKQEAREPGSRGQRGSYRSRSTINTLNPRAARRSARARASER